MRLLFAAAMLCIATPVLAQTPAAAPAAPDSPATSEFKAAMDRMHQNMMIPYTNDTDRDFVQGMIPHHQGAVDMAKIELHYGKDPALKKMAHDIIVSQQQEIVFMRSWLAKHQ